MAEPSATGPTLEQGQTIRTMRDDLERIRSGQMPVSALPLPPASLPQNEEIFDHEQGLPETELTLTQEPVAASEPLAPLGPGDFDLLSHISQGPQTNQMRNEPPHQITEPPALAPPRATVPPASFPALPPTPPPPPPPAPAAPLPPLMPESKRDERFSQRLTVDLPQNPESPLRPEELLALEEETLQTSERRFPSFHIPRAALLGIAGVVVIAAVGAAAYFLFLKKSPKTQTPPPAQTANPNPPANTPQAPKPSLSVPVETRTIASTEEARVDLHEIFTQRDPSGTLRVLLLKIQNDQETRYLSFTDITTALDITFPNDVLSALKTDSFTLLLFNNSQDGSTRVAFAFQATNTDALARAMTQWEKTLPADFDALLLSLGKTEEPLDLRFRTTVRKGLTNHYLNFPEPTTSIDYTIDPSRSFFLMATSRDTMYAAIDALTGSAAGK